VLDRFDCDSEVVVVARLSLSDIAQMLIDQAEQDRKERKLLMGALSDVIAAVTAPRPATAAQEITLSRAKTGDNPTGVDVKVVPQNGETIQQTAARAAEVYEGLAARYPLPNGSAHAATLGADLDDWRKTLDAGAGLHAVPDPEETA
jgi:hypothetical protein